MRATVNLPDDVYEAARSLAHSRGVSLGDAFADLVRMGLGMSRQVGASEALFRNSRFLVARRR